MIKYMKGNLFSHTDENDCILHRIGPESEYIGSFAEEFLAEFPLAVRAFFQWLERPVNPQIGDIQVLFSTDPRCGAVVNMWAPTGDAQALEQCLRKVAEAEEIQDMRLVAPKFGSGRTGLDWEPIEAMINEIFPEREIVIFEKKRKSGTAVARKNRTAVVPLAKDPRTQQQLRKLTEARINDVVAQMIGR